MVAVGTFGYAKAIRLGGHTELRGLLRKPKNPNVRIALRAIVNVVSLCALVILFYTSTGYAASGSVVLRVPRIWRYVSMPIGFGLSVYEFLKILKNRIMNDPPEEY